MDENTITFERLNSIYSDIEGIDVLVRLIDENVKQDEYYTSNVVKLQNYVVTEVELHHYDMYSMGEKDAKNRTISEGDDYFRTLVSKLSQELKLRGMNNEANDVECYAVGDIETSELPNPRMTEKQFIRSLRDSRVEYALKCGFNKTNSVALSRIIEQLCAEVCGS